MEQGITTRYAQLLTEYCLYVQPGERILITADLPALALAQETVKAVFRAGGEPLLQLSYDDQLRHTVEHVSAEVLASEPSAQLAQIAHIDGFLALRAPSNPYFLAGVNRETLAAWHRRMRAIMEARRGKKWSLTLYPTQAGAQGAQMALPEYEQFVYNAMFLHETDPAQAWRDLGARQQRWADRLEQATEVRIEAPGTDLTLNIGGRKWVNSDGKRNMPSGEVFTGPIENSANGVIRFDIPSSVAGTVVQDVEIEFVDGKAVRATAQQGQEALDAQLNMDEGARFLGELGIGTNPHIQRPTLSTLFDEKILGTVHLALGSSYPETGGTNKSALHWDLICDLRQGGQITLDGEPFLVNGVFVQ